jgi:mono/diheme cytochrome c family protein
LIDVNAAAAAKLLCVLMRRHVSIALFALAAALAAAPGAVAGDAANGKKLAAAKCARCHNIEPGGAFKQHPPTFQAIAIYRREPDIWGRIISPSPHSGMPEVVWDLSPDDVQDLVAYIISLDSAVTPN